MTNEERKEEHRKWLAELMRAKLEEWKIHPGPVAYRPALGMTLEFHKRKDRSN